MILGQQRRAIDIEGIMQFILTIIYCTTFIYSVRMGIFTQSMNKIVSSYTERSLIVNVGNLERYFIFKTTKISYNIICFIK